MPATMTHRHYALDASTDIGVVGFALSRVDDLRTRRIDIDSRFGLRRDFAWLKHGIAIDRKCARRGSS